VKRCFAALSLFTAAALALAGCNKSQPTTEFKGKKDDHDHDHDRKDAKIEDIGPYHAGLTAHLPKKDGEPIELDVFFETVKDPKPLPLAATKLTARVTRAGDDKAYELVFEPDDPKERKDDPPGKCSRFTTKLPWAKPEDKLTIVITAPIDGADKKATWVDFVPKNYAHAHDD
jgi:hypothetical protein